MAHKMSEGRMKTVRRFTHFRMKSVRNPEWNEYSKKIFLLHMDGRLLNHVFIPKRSGTWVGIVTGEGGYEHIHITLLQIFACMSSLRVGVADIDLFVRKSKQKPTSQNFNNIKK